MSSLDSIIFRSKKNVTEADIARAAIPMFLLFSDLAESEEEEHRVSDALLPYIIPKWISSLFDIDLYNIWKVLSLGKKEIAIDIMGNIIEYYLIARRLMNSSKRMTELKEQMGEKLINVCRVNADWANMMQDSVPEIIRP